VQDLGVSETPSVVIIDRKGKARLIEGYVDATTLTQAVSDAR
jgi:protein-disulfide isomerase